MTVAGGWLLVPLVLAVLCTGVGLLAEAAARTRVPGPFVPGLGLAGVIALAGVTTISGATASLAAPLCAVCAVAGFVLRPPWRDPRLRGAAWPAVAAVAGFALVAWPSLLSGQASIAGYTKLDDSAIWLGLIDQVMANGRDTADVPPSTYQLLMRFWLDTGYPVGSFTPVGVTARLTGQDIANAYQPVIAVYTAVLALGLYGCVRRMVSGRTLAAACAVVGVQASMLAGFAQWGAVKEIAAAALIPALAGLAAHGGTRSLVLAALPAGALADSFGVGAVLWSGTGLAAGVILLAVRRVPLRRVLGAGTAAGALSLAVAAPALAVFGANARETVSGPPTAGVEELGKLFQPLELLQGAGLWPAGDFRVPPDPRTLHVALAVLGLLAAAGGVTIALRRRAWALPVLLGVTFVASVPGIVVGAPWIDAKFLAIGAPMVLTASAALVAAGLSSRRPVAALGAVILVAGCAWSTSLVARDVKIAPRNSFVELRRLGDVLAGRGPALLLDYEGFADRHFLREADPEGASDLRINLVPDRSGNPFPNFTTVEIDNIDTPAVYQYNVLVRRLTPTGSRPPSGFEPLFSGRFFEAWERDPSVPEPLAHQPLSDGLAPAGVPRCGAVRALAGRPGAGALVAVPRGDAVFAEMSLADTPPDWREQGDVRPASDGTASLPVEVPMAGKWRVWVGGAALGRLSVTVDGKRAGELRHQLDASIGWLRFGEVELGAGGHVVRLAHARSVVQAGRGGDEVQLPLGPVALTPRDPAPLERVPVANARRLCDGRAYDWIEAVR